MLWKSSSTRVFIFIFNLPLFVQASDPDRVYVYVATEMTWTSAQSYCREHHADLATFRGRTDFQAQGMTSWPEAKACWIGLYRDSEQHYLWNWSDGDKANFLKWHRYEPDNTVNKEDCAFMQSWFWFDASCEKRLPFICYDNLILVKENKTWEAALDHCRSLEIDSTSSSYFNPRFDLPHVDFGVRKEAVQDSQTPEVWTGLRFLAGEWLWVNGRPQTEALQACPAPGMYCGAMSKTARMLPMRNCLETRNFLCSKRD